MDNSTKNVTLFATFINDVLKNYEEDKSDFKDLFAMTEGYDLSHPLNKVPIQVYNDMCQWIENNLGKFNLIRVGRNIGETVYQSLLENDMIKDNMSPQEIIQALKVAADNMVQDPKGRGWEILETKENAVLIRRTQTFNSQLQLGLLDGLVRKTGVFGLKVNYVKSIEQGHEFDEYLIEWA